MRYLILVALLVCGTSGKLEFVGEKGEKNVQERLARNGRIHRYQSKILACSASVVDIMIERRSPRSLECAPEPALAF